METLLFQLEHQFVIVPLGRVWEHPLRVPPPGGRVPGPVSTQEPLASGLDSSTVGPHECRTRLQTDRSAETRKISR